jgi:hypothetical protein
MSPDLILGVLREFAVAAQEAFKFLCTPSGQDLVKQSLADKAKFDKALDDLGKRITGGWGGVVKLLDGGKL